MNMHSLHSAFAASRIMAAAALALLAVGVIGCGYFNRGDTIYGHGASNERFTYWSEPWAPKTISLIDTRTDQTLWSVDVPVGKQLIVRFRKGKGEGEHMPDLMQWGLMDRGRLVGFKPMVFDNEIPAPDRFARKLEMTLRPRPEPSPEEMSEASAAQDHES